MQKCGCISLSRHWSKRTRTIQKLLSEVEQQLVQLPAVAVISDISSTSPVDLAIFSKSPVGYKCVWLLVGG